jgi:hypothetical protein
MDKPVVHTAAEAEEAEVCIAAAAVHIAAVEEAAEEAQVQAEGAEEVAVVAVAVQVPCGTLMP